MEHASGCDAYRLNQCTRHLFKRVKCEFDQNEVHFLGHVIIQGELQMVETKINAIQEWEAHTKGTELQSFLGLVNYYRRFMSGYSVKPLH